MTVTDKARAANFPALDSLNAKALGYDVRRCVALPDSQNTPAMKRMLSKEVVVVKENDDGWVLVRYGQTSAWLRPSMLKCR